MARNESTEAKYARVRSLRAAGATFDEIAATTDDAGRPLYANRSTARQAWLRAVADDESDAAKIPLSDLDRLEVDRLELLHRVLWPRAMRGENGAFDRVVRVAELRAAIEARSGRHPKALREAYDRTIDAVASRVDPDLDAALVELGRQYATQIDELRMVGSGSRALYLGPHLAAVLRELLATPAARDALLARVPAARPDDAGNEDDDEAGTEAANGRRRVADFASHARKRRGLGS